MLLALFVENIITFEAIGALLTPIILICSFIAFGLWLGPLDKSKKV